MKLFNLRGRRQTGYCTISEPVNDLSPEVISAIKVYAPDLSNKNDYHSPFQHKSESDESTEPATLTPTPSESSTPVPPSRACGTPLRYEVGEKNDVKITKATKSPPRLKGSPCRIGTPPRPKHGVGRRNLKASMKGTLASEISPTKDELNCKTAQISLKSVDLTTEAPTERMNLFMIDGISRTQHKRACNNEHELNQRFKEIYDTGELDKSFDPEIISVQSDITDPTFESLDAISACRQRWKRLQQGKLRFKELLGSEEKEPSLFEFLLEFLLCQHPTSYQVKRRRS